MKGLLFIILFLSIGYSVVAEDTGIDSAKNSISFNTEYYFGSNALTVDFALTHFRNGFISDEMKDAVSKNLSSSNIFGADYRYELNYRRKPDTLFGLANSFYQIGFRDVFHYDGRFSDDVFELMFRGNKEYAGKKADLSDFEFKQLYYQQMNFTFGHSYNKGENKYAYSVGLNFNKGQKFILIQAPNATLYTSETGEYLDLNAELEIHSNDSSKSDKLAFNGYGGSLDFSFKFTNKKKNYLVISVQDFGMINWNDKSNFIAADTAFRFEGVDISELFDFSDSVTNSISLDSSFVEPYLTKRTTEKYTSLLPMLAKIAYAIPLEKYHTTIETGVGHLFFANSKPFVWQKYQYKLNRSNSFGLSLKYGGYSGFNVGLNYELKVKNWQLQLRTDQVTGFLVKDATAQGAFVSLSTWF